VFTHVAPFWHACVLSVHSLISETICLYLHRF